MGSEVSKRTFTKEDLEKFRYAFLDELEFVKELFAKGSDAFSNRYCIGYELEVCILDNNHSPKPINGEILEDIDSPQFTNELAKYDLEINGNVFEIDNKTPRMLKDDILKLWQKALSSAKKFDANLGLFGVLPSLELEHFDKDKYQSDMHRYSLVSQRLKELRHEDVKILFHGDDEISLQKDDVMLEALGTSLQVHLQIPFDKAVDFYHASLFASVVLTGFSANSPLVLGKRGWHESRIAIFEQSVDTRDKKRRDDGDEKRVHFAHGYIDSWIDLFEQNKAFKIIFADLQNKPKDDLHHFNLHNGTVWRWIRPILGKTKDEKYSLRLELRSLPSGPTLLDTQVNIWFLIGLINALVKLDIDEFKSLLKNVLSAKSDNDLKKLYIKENRYDIIKPGSLILQRVFKKLGISELITSGVGVREGVYLSDLLRGSNDKLPANYNTSVRHILDSHVSDKEYSNNLNKLAKELFELLKDKFNLDEKYKRDLSIAAKLYPSGGSIHQFAQNRHSYYLLQSSLEYGFTQKQMTLISTLVRYAKRKLPSSTHVEKYKVLLPETKVLNALSYILTLSIYLLSHRPRNIDFKCTLEDNKLVVESKNKLYLAEEDIQSLKPLGDLEIAFKHS